MTPSPWTSGLPPHLNTATRPSPGWCCPGGSCKSISDLQNLLMVGGASASVDGYRTIMNLAHENHRDEQGKLSCARVPMEVMSTMLAGMPTRENTFVTCSRTRSPCVRSRQQIGHLLVRVIEDRELDASISRQLMVPTTMPTLAGSPSITDSRSSKPTNFGSLCEPSSRAVQGGQKCNKRKSSCSNNIMFRSPLSRMILSPRPGTQFMSSPRLVTQQGELDMNERQSKISRKRKSPCLNMGIFRSPLRRMVLSPRLHLWVRSLQQVKGHQVQLMLVEVKEG